MEKLTKIKVELFIFVLWLLTFSALGQGQKLKKITILETNNPVLNFNYKYLGLPDSINAYEYAGLKKYVLSKTTIKSKNEPEIYFELMRWVNNQWKHNGWHAAPDSLNSLGILKSAIEEGQEYRCVEYGIVLNDILNSFGYPARTVGLKHIDVDYGGAGMGHVATEVWSNNLHKWIFLDPQFGIYAKRDSTILNIYDIYKLKSENKFNEIEFIDVNKNKPDKKYGDFITNYLGYMDIRQKRNNLSYSIVLKMEGTRDFLTFQSFPLGKMIFTKNVNDVYYNLNQTMIIMDYTQEEIERSKRAFAKLNIKSMEDFNKNMPLFSARPEFILTFDNNMPWFDHYIVKLNDTVIKPRNGKYRINLKNGINTIKVVAVNQSDIKGIPSEIIIKYE